jgi:ribosomal protein S12 methylthiotransferase
LTHKISLISLGCSKNLVDSEIMLGLLKKNNYLLTEDLNKADAIIINTCGFILTAKKESIDTILYAAEFKKKGKCRVLIATGCLVEKYRHELVREIPEIDGYLGTTELKNIVSLLNQKLLGIQEVTTNISDDIFLDRHLTTPNYSAYVKIAEGCDNHCTYCLIPQLRGKYQSRTIESITSEVKKLISQGVKEINIIAQDTTYYGIDLYGQPKLPDLLQILAKEPIKWIRILYSYPARITPELLYVIANNANICNYLDLPIQHADNYILHKMGRIETRDYLLNLIKKIRTIVPDIALRTTCMVGFPGESNKMFQNLISFIHEVRFDWMGAFTYSQEEDTPAAMFQGQVPEKIKNERYHQIMSLQSSISYQDKKKWIGNTISVLVEGICPTNPEYLIGRSQYQAPEVDGVVLIKRSDQIKLGDFVNVRIIDSNVYDLVGEIDK